MTPEGHGTVPVGHPHPLRPWWVWSGPGWSRVDGAFLRGDDRTWEDGRGCVVLGIDPTARYDELRVMEVVGEC